MTAIEITRDIAIKVRDTVDAGLSHGLGDPVPGQMCVEAAVCYALGLPHGDDPACVSPVLRRLKIGLNDRPWSSPQARAHGLRRLAVAQLGSAGAIDDGEFMRRVAEITIRKAVPIGLRVAVKRNPTHAKALEAAAVRCEREGTREACQHAREIASDAYAAASDATYAAYAAATYAAYAATAATDAASAATAAATAAARTCDRVLADYAEWVVQILIQMNAPGCQFLDLVPVEEG